MASSLSKITSDLHNCRRHIGRQMETFFLTNLFGKISAKPNITPLRGLVSPRSKVGKSIIWRGCEGTFYPRGRQRTFSDEKYYWNIINNLYLLKNIDMLLIWWWNWNIILMFLNILWILLKYYLNRLCGIFLPLGQTKYFLRWEILLKYYR